MGKDKPYIEVCIAWDSFPRYTFSYCPRFVNGLERRPLYVEIDGVRYVRSIKHDNCEVLD